MYRFLQFAFIGTTVLLASCASAPAAEQLKSKLPETTRSALCENDIAAIFVDHVTARVNKCDVTGSDSFRFKVTPEDFPINKSAWYGFRVDPKTDGDLRITLDYENGYHRYPPKVSYDGKNWEWVPENRAGKLKDESAVITLPMEGGPFYVSAQEIFSESAHNAWAATMREKAFVNQSVIGRSRDGHKIYMLEAKTEPDKKKPYVMLVGRQHPPEVTGALALMPFSETVLGESDLAVAFREKFNVLIVPNMNPDGVRAGHWRHNKGGMDLNRDWGPFTQPETRAVRDAIQPFLEGEERMAFFLDFHSTWKNLLYTQADDEPTSPPMFARDWVKAVDDRLDDDVYPFTREARHNSGKPISKNYMYDQFGISAITFEVGDHTQRSAIKSSAKVFAEEMMRLLLEHENDGE